MREIKEINGEILNKILTFAARWMELEIRMSGQRSQPDTTCSLSYVEVETIVDLNLES